MAYWSDKLFSMAYADQSDYDAEPGAPSWVYLLATMPSISPAREIEDLGLSVPQDFAVEARVVGSKHGGTLSFKIPLRSMVAAWEPDDTPDPSPEVDLLAEAIGSSTDGAAAGSEIDSGSTACVWELVAGSPSVGCCYGVGAGTTPFASEALGWLKSLAGTTMTMFEDAIAIPTAAKVLHGMRTIHASTGTQPTPKVFRFLGPNSDDDLRFIGCMPTRVVLDLSKGKVPSAEFTYIYTSSVLGGAGALANASDYQRLTPLMGLHQGRLWVGGASAGTAQVAGSLAIGSLRVEIAIEYYAEQSFSGLQGVSDMYALERRAKIGLGVPFGASWISGTDFLPEYWLEQGTTKSISVQVGAYAGQMFGMLIPAARVTSQPAGPSSKDRALGFDLEFEVAEYDGDGAATGAGDTAFRLAFG